MPGPFHALPHAARGHVATLSVDAPRLADNPWRDPSVRDVAVWSPAGHAATALPCVLVLPGFYGRVDDWQGGSLHEPSLIERFDALVASGRSAPFRAVVPDCTTSLGGSQFLDSEGFGAYASFVLEDVLSAVERSFATTGAWGAVGRSSGAYGAFQLARRRPDRIRAIAMNAPDCAFEVGYLEDIGKGLRALHAAGGTEAFLTGLWQRSKLDADGFAALNILAMACAYAGDASLQPLPARLPFDVDAGTIDLPAFLAWKAHDPVEQATQPETLAALRRLAYVGLECGDRDEYGLHLGAKRLHAALVAGGVEVDFALFPGGHRGTAWRYEVSIPKVVAALKET
jgi:enterochelin esterase-like enzyme